MCLRACVWCVSKRLLLISETELRGAAVFLLIPFQAFLAHASLCLMTAAACSRNAREGKIKGLKSGQHVFDVGSSAALNDSLMRVPHFSLKTADFT